MIPRRRTRPGRAQLRFVALHRANSALARVGFTTSCLGTTGLRRATVTVQRRGAGFVRVLYPETIRTPRGRMLRAYSTEPMSLFPCTGRSTRASCGRG